jgi:hypothetical protein
MLRTLQMARRLVKFDFNPLGGIGVKLPSDKRDEILEDVSNYVLESVLEKIGDSESPVTGKSFKRLSKRYAEKVDRKIATMDETGELLDSIEVRRIGNKLRLTVSDDKQPIADGHNDFSGASQLPRRPFIPDEKRGEDFTKEIRKGIQDIIDEHLDENAD